MNWVKSLLSMRRLWLGYSFEPRPNSHALGTARSVMTIGSSINGRSHSKNQSRSLGCGDFKGVMWFRQSLLFFFPQPCSSCSANNTCSPPKREKKNDTKVWLTHLSIYNKVKSLGRREAIVTFSPPPPPNNDVRFLCPLLGALRNYDGDGNSNKQ